MLVEESDFEAYMLRLLISFDFVHDQQGEEGFSSSAAEAYIDVLGAATQTVVEVAEMGLQCSLGQR